ARQSDCIRVQDQLVEPLTKNPPVSKLLLEERCNRLDIDKRFVDIEYKNRWCVPHTHRHSLREPTLLKSTRPVRQSTSWIAHRSVRPKQLSMRPVSISRLTPPGAPHPSSKKRRSRP